MKRPRRKAKKHSRVYQSVHKYKDLFGININAKRHLNLWTEWYLLIVYGYMHPSRGKCKQRQVQNTNTKRSLYFRPLLSEGHPGTYQRMTETAELGARLSVSPSIPDLSSVPETHPSSASAIISERFRSIPPIIENSISSHASVLSPLYIPGDISMIFMEKPNDC